MGELYLLESPSGKRYVGITTRTAEARFTAHCSEAFTANSQRLICRALRKYGKDNICVKTLAVSYSWDVLCLLEQEAIVKLQTQAPLGYNCTAGGEGTIGLQFSAERRARMSTVIKEAMQRPEVKYKHSAAKKAECNSEAGKRRLVEVAARPEVKLKKSEAIRAFWKNNPDKVKERNSKIREASKDPKVRERRVRAGKASSTPEICQLRSDLAKQRRWMHKDGKLTNAAPSKITALLEEGWVFGKPTKLL